MKKSILTIVVLALIAVIARPLIHANPTLMPIGNSINVDMSELPIGIYYIRLKSNGNVFGKTLMISH